MTFDVSSRSRLTTHDLGRFTADTLFDRLARVVCQAGCLPRKELYEAWETARRVRRLLRGGRVVDLAGGHGLLAHALLLLDDSSPEAVVIDRAIPASAQTLHAAILTTWPRLEGRVHYQTGDLDDVALGPSDLVVSSHACGALSDVVLSRAVSARARVAVLPCCHDVEVNTSGALGGWLDPALAIDVMRAVQLERCGYRVWTQTISGAITPKNRLLIAAPLPPDQH
ncbi:MAG: methyltransferase [Vicinamibacterales bacterium]